MAAAFDISLYLALNAGPGTPTAVVATARWLSQDLPLFVAALLALACLRGDAATRRAVAQGLVALLGAWCVVRGLREVMYIPRPAQLGLGTQWIDQGMRSSLPSMHAATAFALAGALARTWAAGPQRAWAVFAFGCALAIGWSRISLGAHLPSDVVAGALLGLGCAWLAVRAASAGRWAAGRAWLRPRGRS